MSLAVSPALVVNDPEHVPLGAAWLRGITPLRLLALAAVCLMFGARPTLWNVDLADVSGAMRRLLITSAQYFVCALPLFVAVVKAEVGTARSSQRVRIAALVLAVVVGALAFPMGNAAIRSLEGNFDPLKPQAWQSWQYMLAFYIRGLSTGGLLAAILWFAAHERDAQRRLHRTRLDRVEFERQAAESRLSVLQAQIEPHFLFNSLASVKLLYAKEPGSGQALLRDLRAYMRVASRGRREREIPLGDEVALAQSLLAIFQVRMGGRLRVRIDVPADLGSAAIPPLMLATLVENAIKHGIAPRGTGGTVSVAARHCGESLEMEVGDDGVGFRARAGHGVGLANIRARLETLYGAAGILDLATNAEGGVTATLRIPHRMAMQTP